MWYWFLEGLLSLLQHLWNHNRVFQEQVTECHTPKHLVTLEEVDLRVGLEFVENHVLEFELNHVQKTLIHLNQEVAVFKYVKHFVLDEVISERWANHYKVSFSFKHLIRPLGKDFSDIELHHFLLEFVLLIWEVLIKQVERNKAWSIGLQKLSSLKLRPSVSIKWH